MDDSAPRCGRPTGDSGKPCANRPMAGTGGACQAHAGLKPTEAQQGASSTNATTHGFYLRCLRDEQDKAAFAQFVAGQVDREDLRRRTHAMVALRAEHVLAWEAAQGRPTALGDAALDRVLRTLPPEPEEQLPVMEEADLVRRVDEFLAANPEVLLKRLPPAAREAARKAMQGGGEPAPA